jgi:hypothetical protein
MSMSSYKHDKSRPFVHEKYRKLAMKKDFRSEAYGKNVTKDVFCKLNCRLPKFASNKDVFRHSYNI